MCRSYAILILSLALFQFQVTLSTAQTRDVELHNLRWDWYVHNSESNQLVPFFEFPEAVAIQFKVDLNKYRNSHLKLVLQKNTFCWVENQLILKSGDIGPLYLSVDSLRKKYGKHQLSITLYNKKLDPKSMVTTIVNRNQADIAKKRQGPALRQKLGQSNTFIISSVVILLLIASFRTAHFRLFREYFQ